MDVSRGDTYPTIASPTNPQRLVDPATTDILASPGSFIWELGKRPPRLASNDHG